MFQLQHKLLHHLVLLDQQKLLQWLQLLNQHQKLFIWTKTIALKEFAVKKLSQKTQLFMFSSMLHHLITSIKETMMEVQFIWLIAVWLAMIPNSLTVNLNKEVVVQFSSKILSDLQTISHWQHLDLIIAKPNMEVQFSFTAELQKHQ